MVKKVKFITDIGEIVAELRRDLSPKTVNRLLESPMEYRVILQVWGEEIFFFLPDSLKDIKYENPKTELERGDVAYWPRDPAICLFWGKTPLSKGSNPVAAGPVNVIGKIIKGWDILPKLDNGDLIIMEKID